MKNITLLVFVSKNNTKKKQLKMLFSVQNHHNFEYYVCFASNNLQEILRRSKLNVINVSYKHFCAGFGSECFGLFCGIHVFST